MPVYYSSEFFDAIKVVKDEGLLMLTSMSIGTWYRALLEKYVTHEEDENGFTYTVMSKAEKLHPNLDWKSIWSFSILTGLDSVFSFVCSRIS